MDNPKSRALTFVLMMGIISMFADMTYEGARSITGPYLATLGASAAVVGFVAGLGEFLGYGLRLLSGYFADRTHRYWLITIIGYCINLLAVPLLALAGTWWLASILIVIERAGKGIRVPPRDAMLSHAAHRLGMGWGFGIHEALDQAGAMIGPLLVACILYLKGQYQYCFAVLLLPALMSLSTLIFLRVQTPNPHTLEEPIEFKELGHEKKAFWVYLFGASFIAFGYADFALIAYHFEKVNLLTRLWIPVTYACALGANIIFSPILGYLYDHKGFIIVPLAALIASFSPPLIFLGTDTQAVIGTILWGIGLGAQGSLMRAVIGNMIPKNKRGSAYGIFNAVFGLFWFIGSALMGVLYDVSIIWLVIFSMLAQLLAIPLLLWAKRLL